MCDPPRKWMRLTAGMSSGFAWAMSPCMIHSKPSSRPSTSTSSSAARMVAAPITLLIPGAGSAADQDGELLTWSHGWAGYSGDGVRIVKRPARSLDHGDAAPPHVRALREPHQVEPRGDPFASTDLELVPPGPECSDLARQHAASADVDQLEPRGCRRR